MTNIAFHDALIGLVTVILWVGTFILLALGHPIEDWLQAADASSLAYLFARSVPGNLTLPPKGAPDIE